MLWYLILSKIEFLFRSFFQVSQNQSTTNQHSTSIFSDILLANFAMETQKRKDDLQRKDSIPKNEATTSSEILNRGKHLFIFFFNSLVAPKNNLKNTK